MGDDTARSTLVRVFETLGAALSRGTAQSATLIVIGLTILGFAGIGAYCLAQSVWVGAAVLGCSFLALLWFCHSVLASHSRLTQAELKPRPRLIIDSGAGPRAEITDLPARFLGSDNLVRFVDAITGRQDLPDPDGVISGRATDLANVQVFAPDERRIRGRTERARVDSELLKKVSTVQAQGLLSATGAASEGDDSARTQLERTARRKRQRDQTE